MPKINVYLPDDLAAAVREAGLPVSAICQRALADAVRTATAVEGLRAGRWTELDARATPSLKLVIERARRLGDPVEPRHLGAALTGRNLAAEILRSLAIE